MQTYEYELSVAHVDAESRSVVISSVSLTPNSAFAFKGGIGFWGLSICPIRAKRKAEMGLANMPLGIS